MAEEELGEGDGAVGVGQQGGAVEERPARTVPQSGDGGGGCPRLQQ